MPIPTDDPTGASGGSMAPPPAVAGGGGGVDAEKAKLNGMVQAMLKQATQGKMGMPAPNPRPDQPQKDYNMSPSWSKKEDIGKALGNMGTFVNNMVAQHKQNQTREALSDWQGFDNALEKAQMVAGDPASPDFQKKMQDALGQMPWVKSMLDPANPKSVKRLKNMYKALNTDLLDDKENVYGQALKQLHKVKAAEGKIKDVKQQQEMAQKRQQTMQSRIANLMQQSQIKQPDRKESLEAARVGVDALKAEMDKFKIQPVKRADGSEQIVAVDTTRPGQPATEVKIVGADGKEENLAPVAGKMNPAQDGKILMVEGKPYGIQTPQGIKTMGDPTFAKALAQQPSYMYNYLAANKAWADAEAAKDKLAGIRADTYVKSREYPVIDKSTGDMILANASRINAHPDQYAPASAGMNAMAKEAVFGDIYFNIKQVDEAAKGLKSGGMNAKARATYIMALNSTEPSNAVKTWLSSEFASALKPDQVNYLTALASLQENAQAIRSVAGMGAGSDMLREAILRAVPGAQTANYNYLNRQLTLFRGTAERLEKGVPSVITSGDKKPEAAGGVIKDASELD